MALRRRRSRWLLGSGLLLVGLTVSALIVMRSGRLRAQLLPPLLQLSNLLPGRQTPRPIQVDFIGQARAIKRAGSPSVPRLLGGQKPALLFSPQSPSAPEEKGRLCDPFGGGELALTFWDASDTPVYTLERRLETLPLVQAESSWRLDSLPDPAAEGGVFVLPELLAHPGSWLAELRWTCARARGVSVSFIPLVVDLPLRVREKTKSLWPELQSIRTKEAAEQLTQIQQLMGPGGPELEPEVRLLLFRIKVRALYMLGRFEDSVHEAEQAIPLAESLGLISDAARLWDAIQEARRDQGDLTRAQEALEKAIALSRSARLREQEATNLYSLALLQWGTGEVFPALETMAQASTALSLTGTRNIQLASRAQELEWLQALGHQALVNRRLEPLFETPGLPFETETLESLGWLLLRGVALGAPYQDQAAQALGRAEALFETARGVWKGEGNVTNLANTWINLCEVALLRGNLANARAHLEQARSLAANQLRLQFFLPFTHARLLMAEGRAEEATAAFRALEEQLMSGAIRELEPLDYARVRAGLAEAAELRAHSSGHAPGAAPHDAKTESEALTLYQEALTLLEENALVKSPLHRAPLLASYASWEARVVHLLLDQGRSLEALTQVEREATLRRSDVVQPSAGQAGKPPTPSSAGRLQALQQELAQLRKRPSTPELKQQIVDREEALQRLWAQDASGGGTEATLRATSSPETLSLSWLQARIPRDGLLLRLAILPDSLVVWSLQAGSAELKVRAVPMPRFELELLIQRFAQACREGKEATDDGRRLAELIFGPDLSTLPPHLLIVGEGALRELPFAALPIGSEPLISRSSVQWLPTLMWPEVQGQAPARATIVADPARDLPLAIREADSVKQFFPEAQVLVREQAELQAVKDAFEQSGVVHFAGHAVSDPDRPYLSYLRLAEGGRLSLMDVRSLHLPQSLVFLNACGAGQVARAGGGALGLADGFLGAGARTVVASRWDVPDEAGEAVARQFYLALQQGGASQEPGRYSRALQRAQQALHAGKGGEAAQKRSVWSAFLVLERF